MKKLPEYIQAEYDATKQAAKLLKQELKQFTSVRFSVTSAANNIGVKATNITCHGAAIAAICKKYEIVHPDGWLKRFVITNVGE